MSTSGTAVPFFDPLRPPPLVDELDHAHLPHSAETDLYYVKYFLSLRDQALSTTSGEAFDRKADIAKPPSITSLKNKLITILDKNNAFREQIAHVRHEWEKRTQLLNHDNDSWRQQAIVDLQTTMQALQSHLDGAKLEHLSVQLRKQLHKRRKKRTWLKRRNAKLAAEKRKQAAQRQELHQRIDDWQKEQRALFEEEKKLQQELDYAAHFLADVHRRKASCKRYLARIKRIQSETNEEEAIEKSEQARSKWAAELAKCKKEEARLRDVLARRSMANFQKRIINEWNRTLFGEPIPKRFEHPLLAAERDRNELIATRSVWDACIVEKEDASDDPDCPEGTIPLGWVFPPIEPLPEWAAYRIKCD